MKNWLQKLNSCKKCRCKGNHTLMEYREKKSEHVAIFNKRFGGHNMNNARSKWKSEWMHRFSVHRFHVLPPYLLNFKSDWNISQWRLCLAACLTVYGIHLCPCQTHILIRVFGWAVTKWRRVKNWRNVWWWSNMVSFDTLKIDWI